MAQTVTALPGLIAAGGVLAAAGTVRGAVARSRRGRAACRLRYARAGDAAPLPWLRAPRWIAGALENAAIDISGDAAWTLWLGGIVFGGAMAGLLGAPEVAVIVLLIAVLVPMLGVGARRGEARRRFAAGMPAVMESIARSLRTGASMRQAIDEAARATTGPLGRELSEISLASSHGQPLVACLEQFAAGHQMSGVRLSVAALCLGIETGGSQARAIDGVATTLRERLAAAAELRALSSQARISALVIGLAPLGFSGFAMLTDPRTVDLLMHTPMGWALVGVGLTLDMLGWLWMRRLCGGGSTS